MYQKVSFEEELPPESKKVVAFKNGDMFISYRYKEFMDNRFLNQLEPISWYTHWLKEIQ